MMRISDQAQLSIRAMTGWPRGSTQPCAKATCPNCTGSGQTHEFNYYAVEYQQGQCFACQGAGLKPERQEETNAPET